MKQQSEQLHDPVKVLDLARALRRQGDVVAAGALLDASLQQIVLSEPVTTVLASQAGWLQLERGHIDVMSGSLTGADGCGLAGLKAFEKAGDQAGQATACLLLGDVNWQGGHAARSRSWWLRACALAEAAGNSAIAARALAAIALAELRMGKSTAAQKALQGAEAKTLEPVLAAIESDDVDEAVRPWLQRAAKLQDGTARATVALVRARQAIGQGAYEEARLLLAASAQEAAQMQDPGLQIDALRLDAAVALREGDPRAAVEALRLAKHSAHRTGLVVQAALIDTELVLALADNCSWTEAFELQNQQPPAEIAKLPAVAAARLESFAVLSRRSQHFDVAQKALREAAAIREARNDGSGYVANLAQQAEVALAAGELEEARLRSKEVALAAREQGRLDIAVNAEITWLHARLRCGDHSGDAIKAAAQLCEGAEAVAAVAQRIISHDLHAALLAAAGRIDEAVAASARAEKLAKGQPLLRLRARAQSRAAALLQLRGEYRGAARAAQKAAETARSAEDRQSHAAAMTVAGQALRCLGRHDESLLALGHASTEAVVAGRRDLAAQAGFALGDGYLTIGRHREARHCFNTALEHARKVGHRQLQGRILRGVASCLAAHNDSVEAFKALQAAVALGDPQVTAEATVDRARLLVASGDPKSALSLLDTIADTDLNAAQKGDLMTVRGHAQVAAGAVKDAAITLNNAVGHHREGDERGLGAALFLLGQVEGMLGHGQAAGEAIGEALVITAKLGLPEQQVIRRAIERLHKQAETG